MCEHNVPAPWTPKHVKGIKLLHASQPAFSWKVIILTWSPLTFSHYSPNCSSPGRKMVLPRSGLRLRTGQGGRGQAWSWLSVPKLSHIARGLCSFQSRQSPPHFHQLFTSPSFKWKKIQPTSSSPCVAPLGAAFLLLSAQSPKQNSQYITPIVLSGSWSWIHVSEGYCNQEIILLISDNGAVSVTMKAFVTSPWLQWGLAEGAGLLWHTGRASLWGDGDSTGVEAHEPRGSKVYCAEHGLKGRSVGQRIFDEAATFVITPSVFNTDWH